MAVLSVERFSIALPAATSLATATLTKGQATANCVPFVTVRATAVEATADRWAGFPIKARFSDATTVEVEVGRGDTGLVVEVTVVEFDPAKVSVQQITTSTTGADITAAITAVDQTKAFVYTTYCNDPAEGSSSTAPYEGMIRTYFSANNELTFTRFTSTTNMLYEVYVVECLGTEWAVQSFDVTLAAVTSNTATLTAVDTAKTFVVGSYQADSGMADDNADGTVGVTLDNATTVTIQRAEAGGTLVYTGYAVEFGAAETASVQHDEIVAQGDIESQNVDFGTPLVDLDFAMVIGGGQGNRQSASFPGSGSSAHGDAFCAWDFIDVDTIRVQHSSLGNAPPEADNDLPWQVIDWRFGAAAPSGRVLWR